MIISLVILIPFCCIVLWAYFKLSPQKTNRNPRLFNIAMLSFAIVFCLIFSAWIYWKMIDSVDQAWWPYLSLLGSLLIFPITLIVGGLLRNLFFFRS